MSASNGTISGFAASEEKGQLKPYSYKARAIGDSDIEIKIDYCGVCGSDLHQVNGGWGNSKFPMIPGHEIIGTVTTAGKQVKKFKVGQRVGLGAQCFACHDCQHCKKGLENACFNSVFTYNDKYADGETAQGGYAQYVRAQERLCFAIPEGLDSIKTAPLMCAGITTFAPIYRANVKGKSVGVVGIGGLGHLGLQWCKALGAKEIYAISHSDKKKQDALKLGATQFINTSDEESCKSAKGKLDFILCTANAKGQKWHKYLELLDVFGHINLVAIPEEDIVLKPSGICNSHVSIGGSLLGSLEEMEIMLKTASEHNVHAWTELLPLEKCNDALHRLDKGDVRYRFVLDVVNHKF